jgi:HEXXH motif-containing protein
LGFGSVAASVDSPVGFAQAIVHEMAHHKLRGLGIEVNAARALIINDSSQLFQSPIRYDCLRPMAAVLHAQYSFTYVSMLNISVVASGIAVDGEDSEAAALYFLSRHIPKLEFGMSVIEKNIQVDSPGRAFLDGYVAWFRQVVELGSNKLRKAGVRLVQLLLFIQFL